MVINQWIRARCFQKCAEILLVRSVSILTKAGLMPSSMQKSKTGSSAYQGRLSSPGTGIYTWPMDDRHLSSKHHRLVIIMITMRACPRLSTQIQHNPTKRVFVFFCREKKWLGYAGILYFHWTHRDPPRSSTSPSILTSPHNLSCLRHKRRISGRQLLHKP